MTLFIFDLELWVTIKAGKPSLKGGFSSVYEILLVQQMFGKLLGLYKSVTGLFSPYHAILFGIMLIFGGASLWQIGDGKDII